MAKILCIIIFALVIVADILAIRLPRNEYDYWKIVEKVTRNSVLALIAIVIIYYIFK